MHNDVYIIIGRYDIHINMTWNVPLWFLNKKHLWHTIGESPQLGADMTCNRNFNQKLVERRQLSFDMEMNHPHCEIVGHCGARLRHVRFLLVIPGGYFTSTNPTGPLLPVVIPVTSEPLLTQQPVIPGLPCDHIGSQVLHRHGCDWSHLDSDWRERARTNGFNNQLSMSLTI